MKIITKKILPEWFDAIAFGKKKYELRLADFEAQDGDIFRLSGSEVENSKLLVFRALQNFGKSLSSFV